MYHYISKQVDVITLSLLLSLSLSMSYLQDIKNYTKIEPDMGWVQKVRSWDSILNLTQVLKQFTS